MCDVHPGFRPSARGARLVWVMPCAAWPRGEGATSGRLHGPEGRARVINLRGHCVAPYIAKRDEDRHP